MKNWLIKKLGGYTETELDEAKVIGTERLGQMKRFEQFKLQEIDTLVAKAIDSLLSNVDLTQIVSLDKTHGIIYIGGERADEARLTNLKAEAEFIVATGLWKLLYENPKELAQRAMFKDSENLDGLKKGRSILYTLSTQQNIIDTLLAFEPRREPTPLSAFKPFTKKVKGMV